MEQENKELELLVEQGERIGVIGSPSSTSKLNIDILGTAVDMKLVGELGIFKYQQGNTTNFALGQITEIVLKNIWHEDPTMRSLIRQRGGISPVSKDQDTHLGEMSVSAVFSQSADGFEQSILGTVPATGTLIQLVDDTILDNLLKKYKDQLFYLGTVYGSKPKLPLWFKHFGSGEKGAGEAYHLGIFGKTGSGKSVLAKMILLGYARHREMGIFILDPQGEFFKDIRKVKSEGFKLNLGQVLKQDLNRQVIITSIKNLVLDTWNLFKEIIIESDFFNQLTISHPNNQQKAADELERKLRKKKINLNQLYEKESFAIVWDILGDDKVQKIIYSSSEPRKRFQSVYREINEDVKQYEELYNNIWKPVCELFKKRNNTYTINHLLYKAFDNKTKPIIIVDLSEEEAQNLFWNDNIQALIIKSFLDKLKIIAEKAYKEDKHLNTLVIIDEAHRFASRERSDNEVKETIRHSLTDAVRTTRKYGLGWMFISQTLSSLHKEIIHQLRIFFFGFGLSMGTEFQALKELAGGDTKALKLYQSFRDPQSSFKVESKQFSFMTIGPVSPLSFSGAPLFFDVYNDADKFLSVNNLDNNGPMRLF